MIYNNMNKYIFELLLHAALVFGRENFYPVRSCTDVKLVEIPLELLKTCADKKGFIIHCLSENDNEDMGLSCFSPIWIDAGECPYYNNYQGNLDARPCKGTQCATGTFSSPLSVGYKGCYPKELISTISATTTTDSTVTNQSTSNAPKTDKMCLPVSEPVANATQDNCSEDTPFLPAAVVFIVISIFLTVFIFAMLVQKKIYEGIREKVNEIIERLCGRSEGDVPQHRNDEEEREMEHLRNNHVQV